MVRSAEISEKTGRVISLLSAEGLGGVLLGSQHNFSWLTAGSSNGIDMSRDPGAGSLLIRRDGKRFVLANRIEMKRLLTEELAGEDFEPVEFAWEEEKASPSFLADKARALLTRSADALGSDLPVGSSVPVVEGALARQRFQLTPSEIERYKLLGRDAGESLSDLVRGLSPGETEEEVAQRAAYALAAKGIRAVVNLVAADERIQQYRHPVATRKRWEKVLMLVVCARRHGLIASLTRIVAAGRVDDKLKRRTLSAARVNARILHATREGATGAELYGTAARAYAGEGFEGEEHLHHQGGATGYRTRDWVAHPLSEESVRRNQAFAWNPSITGTKVEETVIVEGDGVTAVTSTPDWPQIPVTVEGREYLSPDVLAL
jgi:Xaa-Pro aminopeptidase